MQQPPELSPPAARSVVARLLIVLAVAATVCILLFARVQWINGTYLFRWGWQWVLPQRIYPMMLFAAAPAIAAQWVRNRFVAIALLTVSLLAMQLVSVGMVDDPWSLHRVGRLVQSIIANSYFTDAQLLEPAKSVAGWVGHFPEISRFCHLHAREKAPGQILYYWAFIRFYGQSNLDRAAIVSGVGVMVLTSLGVPACYWMTRTFGVTVEAAKAAATYFALMPGFVAINPTFDPVHAIFTCLIVGFWLLALTQPRPKREAAAVACGLVTAFSAFLAYATLTLGAFCAAAAVWCIWQRRLSPQRVAALVGFMLVGLVVPYVLLWIWCGFDPFAMYVAAAQNEKLNLMTIPVSHAYPTTLPSDLKDFLLASGWMSLPLIVMGLQRVRRQPIGPWVWMAVGQILVVCLSGFLRAETARIWLFLQPLALLLIGIELAAWPRWARVSAWIALICVTTCISQNLVFVFG